MIEIVIKSDGKEVLDSFKYDRTNLSENAIVLRRLEEIKLKLLDMTYLSEWEINEDKDWEDSNE